MTAEQTIAWALFIAATLVATAWLARAWVNGQLRAQQSQFNKRLDVLETEVRGLRAREQERVRAEWDNRRTAQSADSKAIGAEEGRDWAKTKHELRASEKRDHLAQ